MVDSMVPNVTSPRPRMIVRRTPAGHLVRQGPRVTVDREDHRRRPGCRPRTNSGIEVPRAGRVTSSGRTPAPNGCIADEAQDQFSRTVSWGVHRTRREQVMFTHLAVPVMARLRQPERRVLDAGQRRRGAVPLRRPGVVRSSSSVSTPTVADQAARRDGRNRPALRDGARDCSRPGQARTISPVGAATGQRFGVGAPLD